MPVLHYLFFFTSAMNFIRIGLTILFVLASFTINADGINSIAKTNKLISKAESAMKSKDFKTAINSYEKALAESPELPGQIYMNLGNAYLQSNNVKKAQKNYLTAAANIPSAAMKSVAFQQVGNISFGSKNYKEAMDWYKKSLIADPTNNNARFNYELAYKLNKQKEEEEKKKNPEQKQAPEKEKQNSQDEKKQKPGELKEQQPQPKSEEKQKGKEEQQKGPQSGSKQPENKPGQQQPGEKKSESDSKQEKGQEKKPDENGEDEEAKKDKETNMDDPEAQRMDRKKLQEAGLTEMQARNLLQAMRQNEVKYLQQRRYKSQKGGSDKDKPKW